MNLHMNRATETGVVGEIDIDKMKRFIAYCKACVDFSFTSFIAAALTETNIPLIGILGDALLDYQVKQRRN